MALEIITTHAEDALARLISQFKEQPNIEGFIRSFIVPFQHQENTLIQILTQRWVSTAVGVQLDKFGTIVGEDRLGRNDDAYRLALYLRIAINVCKGTPEEFIAIFLLLTGCTQAQYIPEYPAAVSVLGDKDWSKYVKAGPDSFAFDGGVDGLGFGDVFDASIGGPFADLILADMNYILFILQSILPAGVKLFQVGWYNGAKAFAFDGGPDGLGFGDVNDSSVGGELAELFP